MANIETPNGVKEVRIIENNQTYYLKFMGLNYFTDNLIEEIVNTVKY